MITNHILDKDYNVFVVDQIVLKRGPSAFRAVVHPEETIKLPFHGVRSLRFTRAYKDYSMLYLVTCPQDLGETITIKLIDVHTNRLPGGCKLVKRGRQEQGAWVKWE